MSEDGFAQKLRPRITEFTGEVCLVPPPNTPESEEPPPPRPNEFDVDWEEKIRVTPTPTPTPSPTLEPYCNSFFDNCETCPQRFRERLRIVASSKGFSWFLMVAHGFVTFGVFMLFNSAMFVHEWRKIFVDRLALALLWRQGKVPVSLLNTTISFSRKLYIFSECPIAPISKLIRSSNVLRRSECRSECFSKISLAVSGMNKGI